MLLTSQQADRLIKKYEGDIDFLYDKEFGNKTFTCATTEDKEEVRPSYNFLETREAVKELLRKIGLIKHCLNVFNTTTKLLSFPITIDEALWLIPRLKNEVSTLGRMRNERVRREVNGHIIDYTYLNYSPEDAEEAYRKYLDVVTRIEEELAIINTTKSFEIVGLSD